MKCFRTWFTYCDIFDAEICGARKTYHPHHTDRQTDRSSSSYLACLENVVRKKIIFLVFHLLHFFPSRKSINHICSSFIMIAHHIIACSSLNLFVMTYDIIRPLRLKAVLWTAESLLYPKFLELSLISSLFAIFYCFMFYFMWSSTKINLMKK